MNRRRSIAHGLWALLAIACAAAPAAAQETRATVTGTVKDAQGATVPGVTVTVTNTDTNISSEATTNEAGVFTVQRVQPGPVKVTAALTGFKTFVRDGLTLRTAETVTLAIPLSVGGLEETVTVSAQASAIESNESTISQTIENKRISELPLNGRQVYMLTQLTAGTLFTQTTFGATGFSGTRAWDVNGSLSVHGSRTGNNEFLVEGAPSSGTGGGTGSWNYAPPVDAIEEFKNQHVQRRRLARPHQRRGDQHDAAVRQQRRAWLRDRAAPGHLAGHEPDPEHPQQHLEQRPQVPTTPRRC